MDHVRARKPTVRERRQLHVLKRQKTNAVNSCHARIILLSHGRVKNREIGERLGITPQWVRKIIHRFNADGLLGILWSPEVCGCWAAPRKFLADVVEQVCEVALSPPEKLIGMTQWSLTKLRQYLVETGELTSISLEWLRQILRQRGVRWRHTKTWKKSDDPEFEAKRRRIRRLYRRWPANGRVICVDEFGPLNLQPRGGHCLAREGKVKRHRATHHRTGGVRHMIAYYDLKLDRLYGLFYPRKTWRQFLHFLRWLRSRYERRLRLYVILDNAGPHGKAEVVTWAAMNNVQFVYTPTNVSWLNRIESHFTP
ncbi:MAG: IS630 family transposase [Planctomycetes bacterium]|nr:IS630 family transposase [Planctomycetota bacterium]